MANKKILKLPGLVDIHVHLREPGGEHKEDFETGTKAAVAGGYTQILDMPNNIPPTVTPDSLNDKIRWAKGRIWCDLGFNFGATRESLKYFSKVKSEVFGLKIYMSQTTGPLLVTGFSDLEEIFKSWESPLPIMVHSEDELIDVALKLSQKYKKTIHICHITANQLSAIKKAKGKGLKISCEVTPHHLFLTDDDVSRLGPLGIMKPPLGSKNDRSRLWDNLDVIDMISTDHAPHTLEEKYDQSEPKFGVPGLETTLSLMMQAVDQKRLILDRLIELLSTKPRKIFKLPAQPNTYLIVDFEKTYKIGTKKLFTKCGWTPFAGMVGRGAVKKVVIGGRAVFENGKFLGKPSGKIITPDG